MVRHRHDPLLRHGFCRRQTRDSGHPRSNGQDGDDEDPASVVLRDVVATGEFLRLCPQHEQIFWREAWLRLAAMYRSQMFVSRRPRRLTPDMADHSTPRVTVGLPVYNSERYLATSLDSLLSQTYRDFVLIISDNASTDGTAEICERYAKLDSRVQYFRNEVNIGNPRNFNRVLELTQTPYLKWATADDFWAPVFLERAMDVMENQPTVALCYPQAVLVDASGGSPQNYDDVLHLVQDDPAERFLALINNIKLSHQLLGVIRMSSLRQTHLQGTHVASDINLLAELTLYGKFVELPERLFFRRFHQDSCSWKRGDANHEAKRYHAIGMPGRVKFPKWRSHLRFIAAVRSSPLPLGSKMRLYRTLLRRISWDRQALGGELVSELPAALSRFVKDPV